MTVKAQIDSYIDSLAPAKADDLRALEQMILQACPAPRLWFFDGRNDDGKIVSNPSIGYGAVTIPYAGGETREFYRIGLSANTAGLSIHVMGEPDKTRLARVYGDRIGKAKVTGYCIKFRGLKDLDLGVTQALFVEYLN